MVVIFLMVKKARVPGENNRPSLGKLTIVINEDTSQAFCHFRDSNLNARPLSHRDEDEDDDLFHAIFFLFCVLCYCINPLRLKATNIRVQEGMDSNPYVITVFFFFFICNE